MTLRLLEHPGPSSRYYNTKHKYRLTAGGLFVFGSNTAGRHGKGAALEAHQVYGARKGVGEGFTGLCYAIPTKNGDLSIRTIEQIAESVRKFKWAAEASDMDDDHLWYYVTPLGTGLAGYSHEEIAPLFEGVANCWLPDTWKPILGNNPSIYRSRQKDAS